MFPLIFIFFVLVGSIAFYSPQKQSLRDSTKTTVLERLLLSKGTLLIAALLVGLAILSFEPTYYYINSEYAHLFGYSQQGFFGNHYYFQPLTSFFFHFNLYHIVANLSILLPLSAYERRVGTLRFLKVFFVSGLFSSLLDMCFISPGTLSMGASGAIAGLWAGYALDRPSLTNTEWMRNSVLVVLLVLFLSFFQSVRQFDANIAINWIVHILGAISAAVYVRCFSLKSLPT